MRGHSLRVLFVLHQYTHTWEKANRFFFQVNSIFPYDEGDCVCFESLVVNLVMALKNNHSTLCSVVADHFRNDALSTCQM